MTVEIPVDRDPDFKQLALFTRIRVFAEEWLAPWDCGLTQPVLLTRFDPENPLRKIGLRYQSGQTPGFEWRVID